MATSTAHAEELVQVVTKVRALKREVLRREVLEKGRIDLLATKVLGYELLSKVQATQRSLLHYFSKTVGDSRVLLRTHGYGFLSPKPLGFKLFRRNVVRHRQLGD